MLSRFYCKAVLILFLGILAGCITAPLEDKKADARAKSFKVPPKMANIYIFRTKQGRAVRVKVYFGRKLLGSTVAGSYFKVTVKPGKYRILSLSKNKATLKVTAKPGKNYFVWQEVQPREFEALTRLKLVNEKKGKEGVRAGKLLKKVDTSWEKL